MDPARNITRNTLVMVNVMIAVGAVMLKVINPIVVSYTNEIRRADIINFTFFTPCIMVILSFILYRTLKPLRLDPDAQGELTTKQIQQLRTAALNIPLRVFAQFNIVILTAVGLVALPIDHVLFPFYPFYKRFVSMGLIWSYTICTSFLIYAYLKKLVLPVLRMHPTDGEEDHAAKIPVKTSISLTAFGLSAMILLFLSSYGYFLTREAYSYGAAKVAGNLLHSTSEKMTLLPDIGLAREHLLREYPAGEVFLVNDVGEFLTAVPAGLQGELKTLKVLREFQDENALFSEHGDFMLKMLPLGSPHEGFFLGTTFSFDPFARKKLRHMIVFLLLIGGFFLLFAWAINYYVAKGVSETLVDIERRTRQLTEVPEASYQEIEVVSNDEIGDLTRAFNHLQRMVHYYHQKLTAEYSKYLSPNVVEQIKINPEMMERTERRMMTVMFSDLKDFTRYSEANPPEKVVGVLNEHFDAMAAIIDKWDGTLDKYMGDGLLAFWGAPTTQENHAELGLRCALEMVASLEELQRKGVAAGVAPLDMGIGLNTGEIVVGNMGAREKKMDYTVIGDEVNLASRIEQLTRTFNSRIIISQSTYDSVSGLFRSGPGADSSLMGRVKVVMHGPVSVKGKQLPVTVYEIVSTDGAVGGN